MFCCYKLNNINDTAAQNKKTVSCLQKANSSFSNIKDHSFVMLCKTNIPEQASRKASNAFTITCDFYWKLLL